MAALPPSLPAPRRHLARALALLVVTALLVPVGVSAATYEPVGVEEGTVERIPDGRTVVGVQGFKFAGQGSNKKPARLISVRPNASLAWEFQGAGVGARWFYDVDPVGEDDLLAVAVDPGGTVVLRIDRETREIVWRERLPFHDTHDVDLLPSGNLLVANMRNYDEETGENDERLLVYNRTRDEVVWEWQFHEHGFDPEGGGDYTGDWTHTNDVERVGDGLYMVSVRNFDTVVVVNHSTGEIEAKLGSDGNHDVLYEQHNADMIRAEDGTPTVIVADSENDRVVEYARACEDGEDGLVESDPDECEWERVWTIGGGEVNGGSSLNWPRDADRLPNGNTLITDTLNHRVIEVTPQGRIVWEYYATWGPYDAERIGTGDESSGPTMRDQDVTGTYRLSNSAGVTPGTGPGQTFESWVVTTFEGTPLATPAEEFAARWAHVTPWLRPNWMTGWGLVYCILAGLVLAGWAAGEAYLRRRRIRAAAGGAVERVRAAVQ